MVVSGEGLVQSLGNENHHDLRCRKEEMPAMQDVAMQSVQLANVRFK